MAARAAPSPSRADAAPRPPPRKQRRKTEWLSRGFEELVQRLPKRKNLDNDPPDFDVVIVGSGYGGAIAAGELAGSVDAGGKRTRVCILERGREYLPGSFPARLSELAGHVRFSNGKTRARGECTGLFDARLGEDINALVANGLGGGSLINAGIMEEPLESVFQAPEWPFEIRSGTKAFMATLELAGQRLGSWKQNASGRWIENVWPDPTLPKFAILKGMGRAQFKAAKLTVATADGRTSANVRTTACIRCGDCMTGCNYQAKESLDVSLLVEARKRKARIYCGATVLFVRPRDDGTWIISATYTDPKLRRRQEDLVQIIAGRVVLAAGTLGSTEILLRSRQEKDLCLSPRLGTGFSANGDMIVAAVDLAKEANATADERKPANSRNVGPTITGMIDERETGGAVVQDLSIPGALRRLGQEVTAMADAFDVLSRGDSSEHAAADSDPCAIDDTQTARILTMAVMGQDTSDGRIELVGDPEERRSGKQGDGGVRIVWPQAKDDERLAAREDRVKDLLARSAGTATARLLSNPLWRVLPSKLEFLFGNERGPLLTVHPLGGCPMGDDVFLGVVNDRGEVFRGPPNPIRDIEQGPGAFVPTDVHEGLVVLDGSIVPASLGINPALTIAALALRATSLLMTKWDLRKIKQEALPAQTRPVFRKLDPGAQPAAARPTRIQVIERLSGPIVVGSEEMHAELSLEFKATDIQTLMSPRSDARWLVVDPDSGESKLRLFSRSTWEELQREPSREPADARAEAVWPVARGRLQIFHRERSQALPRRLRSALPWFNNRGWRDIAQTLLDRLRDNDPKDSPQPALLDLIAERSESTWRLLALAGEVRLLEYDLTLDKRTGRGRKLRGWDGAVLRGVKRLTYSRRGNPWRQLMQVRLTAAPFRAAGGEAAVLSLDATYLAHREVPLLRIVSQEDQPTSLIDLAAFVLYVMRILMRIHTWSFRKPDAPKPRDVCRLPGYVPKLGMPEVRELPVGRIPGASGAVVNIRLARYRPSAPNGRAVLMIHGYSASGTTFAHHATPSLAAYLCERGWDAWIVDLRTSAGMPTAREPWTFEEVANADIPVAIDHVFQETGGPIDVVAHCMGSAMLNMALLGDGPRQRGLSPASADDPYWAMREQLPARIRRLVMSQVAPLTMFSRSNVLRAFVMRYVRAYLDVDRYAFRVEGKASFGDHLLDRLLATLPYPESEFDRENPPFLRGLRTPWVGTRHRMDALYGRDFSVKNMSPGMLDYIDDHFGPLSIETVSQAIHFARFGQLADSNGNTRFASPQRMLKRLTFPMLSVHGEENGLADKSTLDYMSRMKDRLGPGFVYTAKCIEGCGHQDSLIGVTAEKKVFREIHEFLAED